MLTLFVSEHMETYLQLFVTRLPNAEYFASKVMIFHNADFLTFLFHNPSMYVY